MNSKPAFAIETRGTAYLLAVGVLLAWAAVLAGPSGMGMDAGVFVAAWTVMMAAMMLPSAAPLVLLYRRGATPRATLALVSGYLLVWGVLGVPAYLGDMYFMHSPLDPAPVVLAVAGVYQLTPLKHACLRRCRTPADFLLQHWGRSAFRLGMEHGLWCVGCCWALMLVLVLTGSMGIAWVVGIAAVVALEKLTPQGVGWSRLTGVALLLAAFAWGVMKWPGS